MKSQKIVKSAHNFLALKVTYFFRFVWSNIPKPKDIQFKTV